MDTPERVRFRYRIAGPGRRAMAWAVDTVLRLIVVLTVATVISMFAALPGVAGVSQGAFFLLLFVVEWFYGVFFETVMVGQTPGKVAVGIRVVCTDGSPMGFREALLRNLVRGADYLPLFTLPGPLPWAVGTYGLGVLTMLANDKLRRLGDLAAGTVVVAEGSGKVLGDVAIQPPVSEEERQMLPTRIDLNREELGILEDFLRRKHTLSEARAEELAELYAPALRDTYGIEAPTAVRVVTLAFARATGKDREAS